jgi:hypothetical protein
LLNEKESENIALKRLRRKKDTSEEKIAQYKKIDSGNKKTVNLTSLTPEDLENLENNSRVIRKINEELYKKFKFISLEKPESLNYAQPTQEEAFLEVLKCKYNVLYWLHNYCFIPVAGAYVPILLNEKLMTVALLYEASVPHIFQSSRQSSKTTIELALTAWYENFWENTSSLLLNTLTSTNNKNIAFIKDILKSMPKWMCTWNEEKDVNNVKSIANGLNSKIGGIVVNKMEPDATARGYTGGLYMDEIAYIRNISIAYSTIAFTYNTYSNIARQSFTPAPFAITSTPNDLSSEAGAFFVGLWDSAYEVSFDEIKDLYPWEIYEYIREANNGAVTAKVFQRWYEFPGRCKPELYDKNNPDNIIWLLEDENASIEEIGKYDKVAANWLAQSRLICQNIKANIRKDIYCKFINSTGLSVFEEEELDKLKRRIPIQQISNLPHTKDKFNLFEKFDVRKSKLLLSVDPAVSLKGDYLSIVLFDYESKNTIGSGRFKLGKVHYIYDLVNYIHETICPNAVIVVERNNFGLAVIESLEGNPRTLGKLFYYKEKISKDKREIDRDYGVHTNEASREKMMNMLRHYVTNFPETILAGEIIDELYTLQTNKKGKIQAAAGRSDDLILAYSFCLYVIEYYGDVLDKLYRDFVSVNYKITAIMMENDKHISPGEKKEFLSNYKRELKYIDEQLDGDASKINPLGEFRKMLTTSEIFALLNKN